MHRSTRIAGAALAAAVALSAGPVAAGLAAEPAPLPMYRVDRVIPGGVALAINELGDIAGWQTVGGLPRAFVDRDGSTTLLPNPADRPLSVARDLNDAGVVVGHAYRTAIDEPGLATRWTPSGGGWSTQTLGVLTDDLVSEAKGINESGVVVGHSNPRSFLYEQGFAYTDATGMVELVAVSSTFVPQDVNELGVVVGTGYSSAQRVDMATGQATNLGVATGYGYSYAFAINDAGQIAGALTTGSGNSQVVARYGSSGWQVLGGMGETNVGWGINAAGSVVGEGMPRTGSTPGKRAVVFLDGYGLLYVDDLLEAGTDWSVYVAYDINDRGQIAGFARNRTSGATAAVRLSPVGDLPVPTAPTGLMATVHAATLAGDLNRIDLRWTDTSAIETGFAIQRRAVDASGLPLADFARIGTVSPNVTTYSDTLLVLGQRYEYRVRALGTAGNSGYSNPAFALAPTSTPETQAPTVTITSPASLSTVKGVVSVQVRATDNVGIARVELLVDTRLAGACTPVTATTYSCRWDTRKWSNGGWTLYARAWDAAGNLGQASITVFVKNRKH